MQAFILRLTRQSNGLPYRYIQLKLIMSGLVFMFTLLAGCTGSATTPIKPNKSSKKKAEAFLKQMQQEPGVKQTSSGLLYKVLRSGTKCKPMPGSTVEVNYEVKLAHTLEVVDSSYKRGRTDKYPLRNMIPAWKEGIPMMKEGAKWIFYVHPDLAYGKRGSPPNIGSHAALIFTVELIDSLTCAYSQ